MALLGSALSEATKLRGDEKAKNSKTIAESQAAQEAVTEVRGLGMIDVYCR